MAVKRYLKSYAIPGERPMASIFCACRKLLLEVFAISHVARDARHGVHRVADIGTSHVSSHSSPEGASNRVPKEWR